MDDQAAGGQIDDLLGRVVEWVGRARFEQASAWAWRTAEATGRNTSGLDARWPANLADVPHELSDLLWPQPDDPLDGADDCTRQRVLFAAYRLMPCYPLIMLTPAVRDDTVLADYASELRALLDDPDPRLAAPIAYHLWSGDFESGGSRAAWAWEAASAGALRSPRRLGRLLEIAGPVPWSLKSELVERCAATFDWRAKVFASIDQWVGEAYGQVDAKAARRLGWRG